MTSSLQRQEVRIPAIPLPSSPLAPPVAFFPTRLAPGHLAAFIQQTHTCVLPVVIPKIPRVGREGDLFPV